MSFFNCLFNQFKCKENIKKSLKETNKKLLSLENTKHGLQNELLKLQNEKNKLNDYNHYQFIFKSFPNPYEIKKELPENLSLKIKQQFKKSTTQYEIGDYKKISLGKLGVANWRIPKSIFKKMLYKYPFHIFNHTPGCSDNDVLRFVGIINISLYWNCCICAVRTKTRWVIMFWPADDDQLLYADPITNKIWVPNISNINDIPEVILV